MGIFLSFCGILITILTAVGSFPAWVPAALIAPPLLFAIYRWLLGEIIPYQPGYDEVLFARTRDNWQLALYRYRPAVDVAKKSPVILCHGILSNSVIFDLSSERSLARYLSDCGHDVFWLTQFVTSPIYRII